MNFPRRQFLHLVAGAAALPPVSRIAMAQGYPTHPIRLIIPFPPGGVNDAVGRPWADKVSTLLGPVVVENIGGGGSITGVSAVARAQPDGYTILIGSTSNMVVAPIASARIPYDPLRDFEAIYRLATIANAFLVHPSIPVRTLKDLGDYARANAGKLSYATPGVGTGPHLSGEMFKLQIKMPAIVHVPYRGAGPATNDLIGGQVPIMVATVTGQLIELHNAGKLRMLAVTAPQRLTGAPEVPTVIEAGFPNITFEGSVGLFAPKGTPRPIIEARLRGMASRAQACSMSMPLRGDSCFRLPRLDQPPSARRPASVIRKRITTILRRPATVVSRTAVASPSRTRSRSTPIAQPWAIMMDSVHPCGEPASISSALRCSALTAIARPSDSLAGRLLAPVRPGIGADDPAAGAHHARPEGGYRRVVRPALGAEDRPVVAQPARHVERPHAVGAHIAERHWLDRFVDARTGHSRNSVPTLDLVPCQFESLHDCFCLFDRKEGVDAPSTLADVLHDGTGDHGSNRCLFSTNGHEAPHNVFYTTNVLPPSFPRPHHRWAVRILDLDPVPRAGPVGRAEPLRHDALEPKLARVPEHRGAVLVGARRHPRLPLGLDANVGPARPGRLN